MKAGWLGLLAWGLVAWGAAAQAAPSPSAGAKAQALPSHRPAAGARPLLGHPSAQPARPQLPPACTADQAPALLRQPGVVLLDVRTPEEFAQGHAPGAHSVPLDQLERWAGQLDPAGRYVLMCRSGRRSALALEQLKARGFQHLSNLEGGILGWEGAGQPLQR